MERPALALAGARRTSVRFVSLPGRGPLDQGPTNRTSGERTAKVPAAVGLPDSYRLTGEYVDSVASQVGYLPFDFKRHALGRMRGTGSGERYRSRRDQLPDLVPAGSALLVSYQRAGRRAETGIPAGLSTDLRGRRQGLRGAGLGLPHTRPPAASVTAPRRPTTAADSRYMESDQAGSGLPRGHAQCL